MTPSASRTRARDTARRVANRERMIRNKRRLGERSAPSNAVNDENFLIAKVCDSESARSPLDMFARLARTSCALDAHQKRIQETPAAQAFSAILTNDDVGAAWVFRILFSTHRVVGSKRAAQAPSPLRQHFLKSDAVFFDVLVYSE